MPAIIYPAKFSQWEVVFSFFHLYQCYFPVAMYTAGWTLYYAMVIIRLGTVAVISFSMLNGELIGRTGQLL